MNKDFVFKRRLMALSDLLWNLSPKRFNYAHWVGDNWKGKPDLSCGTTACALGFATTMPSLRRLGLHLFKDNVDDHYGEVRMKDGKKFLDAAGAAKKIFGLSFKEYHYLFIPEEYSSYFSQYGLHGRGPKRHATAKQVATHIRTFVKAKYD